MRLKKSTQDKSAFDITARLVRITARSAGDGLDGFDWLARLGGRETAAMVGAIIAARMARMPVILDGYSATMAGAVLAVMNPGALDHCQIGHCSAGTGASNAGREDRQTPLTGFRYAPGRSLWRGAGFGILRAALAYHTGMASFTEASVSTKTG